MKNFIKILTLTLFLFTTLNAQIDIYSNKKYLQIKANELVNTGNYSAAIEMINKGIEKYPNDDYLISLLGRSYKEQKDLEKAELYFQKALELNPNNEFALAYIEQTKKTKNLLKNETQEEVNNFIKDKGVDFLFIFLAILAGEIIASFLFNCNVKNWKLALFRLEVLKKEEKMYQLNNFVKLIYKYFFTSPCPLKNILVVILILVTVGFGLVGIDFFDENSALQVIKTSEDFWNYILDLTINAFAILIVFWFLLIVYRNTKDNKDFIYIDIVDILHKMYLNENIIELNRFLNKLNQLGDEKLIKFIDELIISDDEKSFFINRVK